MARSYTKQIMQLIRIDETELYEQDKEGSEEEEEEPIYFTTVETAWDKINKIDTKAGKR